jgi:hypothetical protein
MYEDQVLNSLLQLRVPAVMSGATTAWYRQHDRSATAIAVAEGSYHPTGANRSRRLFLEWLDALPELQGPEVDSELRALLDRAIEEQAVLTDRRAGPRHDSTRLPAKQGAHPPAVRASVGRVLRVVGWCGCGWAAWSSPSRSAASSATTADSRSTATTSERFLDSWAEDVRWSRPRGRRLRVHEAVRRPPGHPADVLNVYEGVPGTTFVADLADGAGLPDEAFDCVVLTQTLHLVFDVHAAARTLHRVLKPGGVLLLTVPGISPVSTDEWASTWYWSFTRHSARRLFEASSARRRWRWASTATRWPRRRSCRGWPPRSCPAGG